MAEQQMLFDFDFSAEVPSDAAMDETREVSRPEVRRAVMGWLAVQGAAGLADRVPTRIRKFQADAAAFWNVPRRRGSGDPGRFFVPCRTMIVECRASREACWPHCADSRDLVPRLRKLRRRALELEASIREAEPHLRAGDALFEEYSDWDYARSANPDYHQLRKEMLELERVVYRGTRFETMRTAGLADVLYLAAPENTVHPDELADGWGLLWIGGDRTVRPIREAVSQQCGEENRFHLVQNIAAVSARYVLFAHGVEVGSNGSVRFRPPPRRRRLP